RPWPAIVRQRAAARNGGARPRGRGSTGDDAHAQPAAREAVALEEQQRALHGLVPDAQALRRQHRRLLALVEGQPQRPPPLVEAHLGLARQQRARALLRLLLGPEPQALAFE